MKIAVGADHAAYALREAILPFLRELGHSAEDFSSPSYDPDDDYPDIAAKVARAVAQGQYDLGIVMCGTGIGCCIAANKVPGVRAGLCQDTFTARASREHNDTNILCLGGWMIGVGLAKEVIRVWLATEFSGAERHRRRLAKVERLERGLP